MVRVYTNIFQGPDSVFEPIKFGRDLVDTDFHASRRMVPVGTLEGRFPITWRRAERTESINDHTVDSWDSNRVCFLDYHPYSEVEHWRDACLVRFADYYGIAGLRWSVSLIYLFIRAYWLGKLNLAVIVTWQSLWSCKSSSALRCSQCWRKWITCL